MNYKESSTNSSPNQFFLYLYENHTTPKNLYKAVNFGVCIVYTYRIPSFNSDAPKAETCHAVDPAPKMVFKISLKEIEYWSKKFCEIHFFFTFSNRRNPLMIELSYI
ncbi:hypothetical protein BpHYR1_030878 [Brachionus plicatilis]|uniref:Uncharacterized protein n=1 Tax=Brachionus plicatilis TaxID=10195 RepID=A0A3M7QHU4_BRAPC|nr:hypothetical protein BpHYR1_030878 [Brachionus plicatilis]